MKKDSQHTILETLQWGNNLLQQAGLDTPELDASLLLAHVLKTKRSLLFTESFQIVKKTQMQTYTRLLNRRLNHEPIAYLIGTMDFAGLTIQVNSSVLIPRPETELLVDVALQQIVKLRSPVRILDLCTGSGCIAITLAKHAPQSCILGTDINAEALTIARKNARKNGLQLDSKGNLQFRSGDLFSAVPKKYLQPVWDIIITNPPYIASSVISQLDKDVQDFEPHLALDGGNDGLHLIRTIIKNATDYLKPDGWLMIEIGYDQGEYVKKLLENQGQYQLKSIQITKDLSGLDRLAKAQKGS
jgi:release factor glutamine methyltransferase